MFNSDLQKPVIVAWSLGCQKLQGKHLEVSSDSIVCMNVGLQLYKSYATEKVPRFRMLIINRGNKAL